MQRKLLPPSPVLTVPAEQTLPELPKNESVATSSRVEDRLRMLMSGMAPVNPVTNLELSTILARVLTDMESSRSPEASQRYQAPFGVPVRAGSAMLRIHYSFHTSEGCQFGHDLDIPLPSACLPSMQAKLLQSVQASLSTLVLPSLYGDVTNFIQDTANMTAHTEVPLRLSSQDGPVQDANMADLESTPDGT